MPLGHFAPFHSLRNYSKLILNIPDAVRFSRGGAGCPYLLAAENNRTFTAQAIDSPHPLLPATAKGEKQFPLAGLVARHAAAVGLALLF